MSFFISCNYSLLLFITRDLLTLLFYLLFVGISGANYAIFTGLKNSALPSFSPGLYRRIVFPRFLFFLL
jgi:hypothetical protein